MPPDTAGRRLLEDGAAALGIAATGAQIDALLAYLQLLDKWNRVYNLTALRDPVQRVTHHLLDSMSVVGPLMRHLPAAHRLLDVGSGAGFPGAVVAVLRPGMDVTCLDAVGKKATFVQQAAAELGIANLHSAHGRVETFAAPPFDVVASRAFASLADFVAGSRHLLADGGCWLAMKGTRPDAEIADLPSDIDVFHVEHAEVPSLDAERHLVWMRMRTVAPAPALSALPAA